MAKQNENGVYQMPNGMWAYRFTIVVNGKSISRKKTTDEFGNKLQKKTDAIKARARAICSIQSSGRAQTPSFKPKTIGEVFDEYCEKGRIGKAYSTIRKQDSLWNNHLKERFARRFINDVTRADITDYLSELYYVDALSYRYVESFLKMFYLIYGQAFNRNYISSDLYNQMCQNKETKITMPKMKTDEDMEIVSFNQEEIKKLDAYFKDSNSETAYLLGKFCGLRINECYGIKWENVDLVNGYIVIDRQMQYQDGLIKLIPLKTHNARRTVYMCQQLKEYLSSLEERRAVTTEQLHALRQQNETIITDIDGKTISSIDLLNSLPDGTIRTVNSMKYHSRTIKSHLGINFKYHYLRHTYGTRLAEMNTPTHLLCNQMGHASSKVTEKYYLSITKRGVEMLTSNLNNI